MDKTGATIGSNFFAVLNPNVNIAFTNEFGFATVADCYGNPNIVAIQPGIYNTGCFMTRNDILSGNNVYTNQGTLASPSWVLIGSGGGGGSITIGDPVAGGDPTDVLYIDIAGNVGQNDLFTYDPIGGSFNLGFNSGDTYINIYEPGSQYQFGDINGYSFGSKIGIFGQYMVYTTGGYNFLDLDGGADDYRIGDFGGFTNGNYIDIQNSGQVIYANTQNFIITDSFHGNGSVLSANPTLYYIAIGDIQNFQNQTTFTVDDPSELISAQVNRTFEVTDTNGDEFLFLHYFPGVTSPVAPTEFTIGDIEAVTNTTVAFSMKHAGVLLPTYKGWGAGIQDTLSGEDYFGVVRASNGHSTINTYGLGDIAGDTGLALLISELRGGPGHAENWAQLGDINGTLGLTLFTVDDARTSIYAVQDNLFYAQGATNGNVGFQVDFSNGPVIASIGDVNSDFNLTTIVLDDTVQAITIQANASLIFQDNSGEPYLDFEVGPRTFTIGDVNNAYGMTNYVIDDTNLTHTFQTRNSFSVNDPYNSNAQWLDVNPHSEYVKFGDISGVGNNTVLSIDDTNENFTMQQNGFQFLNLDGIADSFQMGDISGRMNGQRMNINDSTGITDFYGSLFRVNDVSGAQYFEVDAGGGVVTIGNSISSYSLPLSRGSIGDVLTQGPFGATSFAPPASSSIAIGTPVGSSSPYGIFFADGSSDLAQDAGLFYQNVSGGSTPFQFNVSLNGTHLFNLDASAGITKIGNYAGGGVGPVYLLQDYGTTGNAIQHVHGTYFVENGSSVESFSVATGSNTVRISNAYTLPTTAGTNGFPAISNGSGASAWSQLGTAGIATSAVTYAKIQNVTAARLLGNPTGLTAAPSEITLGTGLSFSGSTLNATGGTGTVTSISGSGGTTGLTLTGGPITTSGTLTLGGTLAIANGGTGQTTANAAFNALAPSQTGQSGKFLTTNGTNTSWGTPTTTLTIGQTITGGNAYDVLFVDASAEFFQSGNFQYDPDDYIFKVGFTPGQYLSINKMTDTYQMGDFQNTVNGVALSLLDTSNSLNFTANVNSSVGAPIFSINATTAQYQWGDIGAHLNGTKILMDDVLGHTTVTSGGYFRVQQGAGDKSLLLSYDTNLYAIGDLDGFFHNTKFTLDDGTAKSATIQATNNFYVQNASGQRFANFANTTGIVTLGDISGFGVGNQIVIDTAAGLNTEFTLKHRVRWSGQNYFLVDGNSFLYQLGDIGGTNNHSYIQFNDATQIYTINSGGNILQQVTPQATQMNNAVASGGMFVDTSGGSSTIASNVRGTYYDPASLVASATITLPATPVDGQEVLIIFGGTIATGTTVVTLLTIAPNSGQTTEGTLPTTAAGGTFLAFKFRSSNSKWYRID